MDTALDPVLFPAANHTIYVSHDRPSSGTIRPFGMNHTKTINEDTLADLGEIYYDSRYQINVDTNGDPVALPRRIIQMGTSTDTRFDNQWFVDKD